MKDHCSISYERICKSIESANNLLQLRTIERLIELFRHQSVNPELSEKLQTLFLRKAEPFHYFEWKYDQNCISADAA